MPVLPAEIPTGLVTGQFYFVSADNSDGDTDPTLTVVTGDVTFKCSAPALRMVSKPATVIPLEFKAKFDENGNLVSADDPAVGIELPGTDSELFNPTGFTWKVSFDLKQVSNGHTVILEPFNIQVPTGQTTDLTSVWPVDETPGVITIQGPAGGINDFKPNTFYPANTKVVSPGGDIVSAKVTFTSGAAYNANDWNASSQDNRITAIEGSRWFKGGLTTTSPISGLLGSISDGEYRVSADSTAATLGLPYGRAGDFKQISFGTFGFQAHKTLLGEGVRLWSSVSNAWGAWTYPERAYTDSAVASVKWYQGGFLSTTPVNGALGSITDGVWRASSDTRAVELALPDGRAGKLTQVSSGTFGFQVYESIMGLSMRLWSSSTSTWGAWTNPAKAYADATLALAKAYTDQSVKPASGNKLVPLILTAGHGGGNYSITDGTVRYPMWWGAELFRARVHIRNINPRENQVFTGAVSFPQGLYVGTAPAWDGVATDLVQIAAPFSTPANGDDWVSDWFEFNAAASSKHVLSAAYTASGNVVANAGGCWTASGHIADSAAGVWTRQVMAPFDIWIEAETAGTTPTAGTVGDSLVVGTGATLPVLESPMSQHMRAWGGLPIHYAHVGDTLNSYNGGGAAGSETYKKTRWQGLARPDSVTFSLVSNDIFGLSASLATAQSRMLTTIEWVKANLSSTIFVSTVTPRDAESGAKEDVRRAFNLWLKDQIKVGGVARGVFDYVPAISSDDETIRAELNADGIHLNTAGYASEAALLKNLTSRPLVYQIP